MSEDSFQVTWQADDGYCGGSRPQHFDIPEGDIEGMNEGELRAYFHLELQDALESTIHPVSEDEDRFVAWALERQKEAESE